MKTNNLFPQNKEDVYNNSVTTTVARGGGGGVKPEKMFSDSSLRRRALTTTNIHIMALDGVVNVNSLFTLALFLGLSWYPTSDPQTTLIGAAASDCAAGSDIAEGLIAFHVYSFSSFLFSSLIALALKQAIRISGGGEYGEALLHLGRVNRAALRFGMMASAFGSVFGCGFLMMALVDLVQIKLGTLACGSVYTFAAVVPLVILVPLALFVYLSLVLHAFTR
ncbi:maternal effect embryo arrest [Parasponia andersonii]|uniref:Maternal effect embryo arrest n=1 Tax=Parasponia andersonii TaxID=3476 RepID=A0A2P5AK82_PARAD|nr:maternal effect embryo arrest [Parasponia andersonii]